MVTITKLGIIKGGGCEKIFKARRKRERGAELAINWLLNHGCIDINKGWCKIIKMPKCVRGFRWVIDVCKVHGGDAEIGWRRFMQDVAQPVFDSGKKFRVSKLHEWGATVASMEFSFSGTFTQSKIALTKPHLDSIYKKWINE